MTYLAALQLERIVVGREPFGWTRWAVGLTGSLVAAVAIAAPFVMMRRETIAPLFAASPFAQASLMAPVTWTGLESLAGVWLLGVLGTAHLLHARRAFARSAIVLFAGTGVFVPLVLACFAGKVEAHTQRAAVEFFQARRRALLPAHPELPELRALVLRAHDRAGARGQRAGPGPHRSARLPGHQDHGGEGLRGRGNVQGDRPPKRLRLLAPRSVTA